MTTGTAHCERGTEVTNGTDDCPTNRLQITVPGRKSHRTRLPPRHFQTQLQGWPRPTTKPPEFWLADGRCSSRGDRKAPGSINVTTHHINSPRSIGTRGTASSWIAVARTSAQKGCRWPYSTRTKFPDILGLWKDAAASVAALPKLPNSSKPRRRNGVPSVLSGGSPDRLAPIPTSTTNAAPAWRRNPRQ